MAVEQVSAMVPMTGEMKLDHALGGHRVDIAERVKAVVKRVNEDVIDVPGGLRSRPPRPRRSGIPTLASATR